jgi:hypothetical protein
VKTPTRATTGGANSKEVKPPKGVICDHIANRVLFFPLKSLAPPPFGPEGPISRQKLTAGFCGWRGSITPLLPLAMPPYNARNNAKMGALRSGPRQSITLAVLAGPRTLGGVALALLELSKLRTASLA